MAGSSYAAAKAREWQRLLLRCVASLIVFETLTGLAIYLLPFSVPNEMAVLFHTALDSWRSCFGECRHGSTDPPSTPISYPA